MTLIPSAESHLEIILWSFGGTKRQIHLMLPPAVTAHSALETETDLFNPKVFCDRPDKVALVEPRFWAGNKPHVETSAQLN